MQEKLSEALGQRVDALDFFQQGQIGDIYKASVEGQNYMVKTSTQTDKLGIEAKMLGDLDDAKIRVPKVIMAKESFLVLETIETVTQAKCTQEIEAAKLLSRLHSVTNESRMYGYYYDTTIGPFPQRNEQTQYNWTLFLGQMRIMPMARLCYDEGKISKQTVDRLEGLCRDLYKRVDMSKIYPSLLHGDVWSGNVLFERHFLMPTVMYIL